MSYDSLRMNGKRHKCPDCNRDWYDMDGGCDCGTCKICGTVMDAEELGDSGICQDCELAEQGE